MLNLNIMLIKIQHDFKSYKSYVKVFLIDKSIDTKFSYIKNNLI